MKINCSTQELSKGVQTIQSALSARTTLPVLLNFLMETENSKVKLISTDLQMGVKHYICAEIENEGSIAIPAKKFSDIIHTLPADQDVFLSIADDAKIHVTCGRSRFVINGTSKAEYPVIPEFIKEKAFSVPSALIAEMVARTIFAASTDETRYVLNGVLWRAHEGQLEMVATDGRRLALARGAAVPKEADFKAIVPTKILQELQRVLGRQESGDILLSVTDNQIAFQTAETTMLSRLVEGSFPNHEQVVPSKSAFTVEIPIKAFATITKQASLCCQERAGSVRFLFKPGVLQVRASSQTIEFEDEIPIEYQGEEMVIAFNPQFILDGLKAMGGDSVRVGLNKPDNPALMEPVNGAGYQYVVMPMRA